MGSEGQGHEVYIFLARLNSKPSSQLDLTLEMMEQFDDRYYRWVLKQVLAGTTLLLFVLSTLFKVNLILYSLIPRMGEIERGHSRTLRTSVFTPTDKKYLTYLKNT